MRSSVHGSSLRWQSGVRCSSFGGKCSFLYGARGLVPRTFVRSYPMPPWALVLPVPVAYCQGLFPKQHLVTFTRHGSKVRVLPRSPSYGRSRRPEEPAGILRMRSHPTRVSRSPYKGPLRNNTLSPLPVVPRRESGPHPPPYLLKDLPIAGRLAALRSPRQSLSFEVGLSAFRARSSRK